MTNNSYDGTIGESGVRLFELQREIHDALRVQHPEWVQPDGECPTCESYESRLAELLGLSTPRDPR
jgi:hypothetical protein